MAPKNPTSEVKGDPARGSTPAPSLMKFDPLSRCGGEWELSEASLFKQPRRLLVCEGGEKWWLSCGSGCSDGDKSPSSAEANSAEVGAERCIGEGRSSWVAVNTELFTYLPLQRGAANGVLSTKKPLSTPSLPNASQGRFYNTDFYSGVEPKQSSRKISELHPHELSVVAIHHTRSNAHSRSTIPNLLAPRRP